MRPFFGQVVDAIRTSAVSRGLTVRQTLTGTRTALIEHRHARRMVGAARRVALQAHRASVIGAVRAALAPVMPARRPPAPAGRPEIGDAPTARPHAEHAGVWELWPEASDLRDEGESPYEHLQSQVLRLIERHPEGIRAVDIGNQLGVDWRRVLAATFTLAEAGSIEQIEQQFYPVAKASRRW